MAGLLNNTSSYVPHKIRSHPFKCITLPFHFVLLFIFVWFAIYPLVFVNVRSKYTNHYKKQWSENWSYYFWLAAFLLYLFLLGILVCFWRHTPNYELVDDASQGSASIRRRESRIRKHSKECHSICIKTLNKNAETENSDNSCNEHICYVDLKETSVGNIQEQSSKMRPAALCWENEKIKTEVVLECIPSPLTPREQFFFDLLTAANQSVINATINFIENEKLNCEKERLSYSEKIYKDCFIANVPQNYCRSEAFIFVNSN